MSRTPDRLYDLLPVIYRLRDAEQGYPLRALLRVIGEQVDLVEADIEQLYENWFIETAEEWVVPYIGDLIGYHPAAETGLPSGPMTARDQERTRVLFPRREIANTIAYRRRKGTLALLELLSNDVAGWPARAVEFYRRLGWTQHVNHLRVRRGGTANLRHGDALDLVGGAFDGLAHTVDVRRVVSARRQGRYNLPSVGVFAWRLKTYSVTETPAYCCEEIGPNCYTFSVLGNDVPLYNLPQPEPSPTHIADELNLPTPIRRRAFEKRVIKNGRLDHTEAAEAYYGVGKSLTLWVTDWPRKREGQSIPAASILPANLTDWEYRVPTNRVAVDPVLGRIMFPAGRFPKKGVHVSYHYAFSADMGGGEYDRPIPAPSIASISRFRRVDFQDLSGLAARLHAARDPVSQYIVSSFSATTRNQLGAAEAGGDRDALADALIHELNQVLADETLYEEQRFVGIDIPSEAALLLDARQPLALLARRNRLLLEAAFSGLIGKSFALYRVGARETMKRIQEALDRWTADSPRCAVIELTDSGVYSDPLYVTLREGQSLHIRAANRKRPVIRLLDYMADRPDAFSITGGPGSRVTLDGLLVTGRGLQVYGPAESPESDRREHEQELCELVIRHCTLVPGWGIDCDCEPRRPNEPSLELFNSRARVRIEHSIIGSIRVTADDVRADPIHLDISDSIVDATDGDLNAVSADAQRLAYTVLTLVRCTVIGQVRVHAIELGENSICDGAITVARRQLGCMRFCYVVPGSRTPRRYRCQPDLVQQVVPTTLTDAERACVVERERIRVRPQFNSTRFGTPRYGQLAEAGAAEIATGADDGSEMGAFHDLYQPQRASNLRARLAEYVPADMEAGIIFET